MWHITAKAMIILCYVKLNLASGESKNLEQYENRESEFTLLSYLPHVHVTRKCNENTSVHLNK